ncbi:MAG: HU family DNA-binding protein [Alphaproteobacteria bacterium]|nr:HU family DNA-binding protein [Alphaproteobacteria bacterium]
MTWSDLVARVAVASDVSPAVAREVLRSFVTVSREALVAGERVAVPGLGTLAPRWRAGRTVRHVRTGRKLSYDGRFVAHFAPSSALRQALAARSPQPLKDAAHQQARRLAEALVGDIDLYHRGQVPTLPPGTGVEAVDVLCVERLGPVWTAARGTWDERVPERVRGARDWLAESALRRWTTA